MYKESIEIDHLGLTHSDGMPSRSWSPKNMLTQLRKLAVLVFCVTVLASFTTRRVMAQTTSGGVSGTVKDSTGAVVRGAQITLTNEGTQVVEKTVSTSSGEYIFSSVPLGTYTLRASARGFRTYVDKGIQVHIESTVTADVPLVPGSVQEVVTVTSSVPLLQAQDATLGQTVTTEEINDLPLNGRAWLSLAGIAAGSYALGAPGSGSSTAVFVNSAEPGQVDFRLNGADNNNNVFGGANAAPVPDAMQEFKIQSGNNSAKFGQFAGAVINAQLKSGSNTYRGDVWTYLRNEALAANNYFNNLNGVRRPPYRQNQWGGTIGGPVYIPKVFNGRDKTFFFFDFQHNGILQYSPFTETVPTALMHSSGFTNLQDLITGNVPALPVTDTETDALGRIFSKGTVLDPATTRGISAGATDPISGLKNGTAATVYVRDPFYSGGSIGGITNFTGLTSMLNVIPASRQDPNAVALLNNYPRPTTSGLINDFFTVSRNTQHTNQYDVRIDENISQKDLVWGAYSHSHLISSSVQPFAGPIGENLGSQGNNAPVYQTTLHYNHIFNVSIANEMTLGYNHLTSNQAGPSAYTLNVPEQYGIQGIPQFPGNGGLPAFIISGMASIGGHGSRPSINADTGLQYQDNLMIVRSNQVFNIGFNFDHIRGNITQPPASRGQFSFTGAFSDINNKNLGLNGIADLLITPGPANVPASSGVSPINNNGGPASFVGSDYGKSLYYANYYAGYAQDDWRPTSNLTINIGFRYDHFTPYGESRGDEANLVLSGNGNQTPGTYYIPQAGCNQPRSAQFDMLLIGSGVNIQCVSGNTVNNTEKANIAPRLGLAYRIPGHRIVIRGGYGISYGAFDSVGYGSTLGTNYPFLYTITSQSTSSQAPVVLPNGATTVTMEDAFAAVNLNNPALVSIQGLLLYGKQYNYQTPRVTTVNVTTQDQFTNRDSIQVGYVGSFGRHLDAFGNFNSLSELYVPGTTVQPFVPMPNFARNSQFLQSIAITNYNSMQAIYTHQFRSNLNLLANYTYGKCMSDDEGKAGLDSTAYRAEWLPGFGIERDYAPCAGDATHLVHIVGETVLPIGRGQHFLSNVSKTTNNFIGGWQVNYIFTSQTGQPINVGCAIATSSGLGCNADLSPTISPYSGVHNRTQWFNPSAFVAPPPVTVNGQLDYSPLGSAPSQVRGPGFYNIDASLFKSFLTGRETRLEFRAEFFNVLNHTQLSNPGQLNYATAGFSTITATREAARIGQLALKFFY
jgi:hypothetical protein